MYSEYTKERTVAATLGGHAGAGNSAANQIMPPSEVQTILKRLEDLSSVASDVASTAMAISERLLGSVPESDEKSAGVPCRAGRIGEVHDVIDTISRLLERACSAQERLNRL